MRDVTGAVLIGGVMEHVEEAGVHSGDSACVIPPPTLPPDTVAELERLTEAIAAELVVIGPINVQFAVRDGHVFVIEANPRASRTVPFVAKATGIPLAKIAARVMAGATLAALRSEGLLPDRSYRSVGYVSVKEAVLPFNRFPEVDALLGPEMRSTGEVMGIASTFPLAFAKSQVAAGGKLPSSGAVFFSLADRDKARRSIRRAAHAFVELGFSIVATEQAPRPRSSPRGSPSRPAVAKLTRRHRWTTSPSGLVDAVELIAGGSIALVVNTRAAEDLASRTVRAHPRSRRVGGGDPGASRPCGTIAAPAGSPTSRRSGSSVKSLQEHHEAIAG